MNDIILKLQALSLEEDNLSTVIEIIDFYCDSLDETGRVLLRNKIFDGKINLKLLSLSEIVVENSLSRKDPDLLYYALSLHSLEDFKWDYRENYIYLSIINYAYDHYKQDIAETLGKVRGFSSNDANQYFLEFFNRPKTLKSLRAMGLMATKIDKKIKFDTVKPPWST